MTDSPFSGISRLVRSAALASALVLAACGGSSGAGPLKIVSCSLGCSGSGAGGEGQVSCGIADVFVNGELQISFSQPIDESSLSVFSFQVTELGTGKAPSAKRFVLPSAPNVVVYRPSLTFDSSGSPVFGLKSGATYTLKLPGTVEDSGAVYVRSKSGVQNQHRMLCTLDASLGILDPKPGAPTVTAVVDVVTAYDPVTGEPSEFALGVPAEGAVGVYRFSRVELNFDDLMNPATLVNPIDGSSSTLRVAFDPDGDVTDESDQLEIKGAFSIQIDQDALSTRVLFEPSLGFPSAGSDPGNPRKIVVHLEPAISDLGGNPLKNGDDIAFVPEAIVFAPAELVETFDKALQEDASEGGADWGGAVAGVLQPGLGGGSGKHGALRLTPGMQVTLNTDFEDFSSLLPDVWTPASVIDAEFDGESFAVPPVTDGVFEFSSLDLASASILRFVGSRPARVFVRGTAFVRGTIDAGGEPGPEHSSLEIFGADPTEPGPSGGLGGVGGRLPTWVGFESYAGTIVPADPLVPPPVLEELNGAAGENVSDNLLVPTGTYGAGEGGLAWPQPTPENPTFHLPASLGDILGIQWDGLFQNCGTKMQGSVGAGGGFGLNGSAGTNTSFPGGFSTVTKPPLPTPGSASDFGLGIGSDPESPARRLSPEDGWLHGGAGGGGGGSHIVTSRTNGSLADCLKATTGGAASILIYNQASSSAGGSGGGALQLQAGRSVAVEGRLSVRGGSGGSKVPTSGNATSGGGGSGGALLVQAPTVSLTAAPARFDVSGGSGGVGAAGSVGGRGGAGLLRVEQADTPFDPALIALTTAPTAFELAPLGATPGDILGSGVLMKQIVGPNGLSGAQSCWMQPDGVFYQLDFLADGAELGWDMMVIPNPPTLGEQSFRGENDLFPQPLEELFGSELGASPLVVRFQGVRIVSEADDLCALALAGEGAPIQPGSLTGWVLHPAELSDYFGKPALRPNAVRFQILFDETVATASAIQGVSSIRIHVQPD